MIVNVEFLVGDNDEVSWHQISFLNDLAKSECSKIFSVFICIHLYFLRK
jgi:hypothetical protein